YQDEITLGIERQIGATLTIGARGTYRRLGTALEDRCDFDYGTSADGTWNGTYCAVVNPGSDGAYASGPVPPCSGDAADTDCVSTQGTPSPAARRTYKGIEILARENLSAKLWLQASYVYSQLTGNYDGAVNEELLGTDPGRNTDFDFPQLWQNASGRLFL